MIYFKADYVTVQYFEKEKMVEVEWHGHIFSTQFRETLEMILDLLNEKKVENFLVNRQNMNRVSLADETWREESWFPRFLQSPVKRSASVISRDYYNEVSVSRLIEEKDQDIKIERRRFYDCEEAKSWLLESTPVEADKTIKTDK